MKARLLLFPLMAATLVACQNQENDSPKVSEIAYPYFDTITMNTGKVESWDTTVKLPDSMPIVYYVKHVNKDSSIAIPAPPVWKGKWAVIQSDFNTRQVNDKKATK